MISSAFKSAEVNKVNQQNQRINTVTTGIKDIASVVGAIAGGAGAFGESALGKAAAKAMKYNLANKIGGVGGAIMLSTMDDKVQSAKNNNEQTWNMKEIQTMTSDILGDNPINRNAQKQLDTVFNILMRYGKGNN